MKYTKREKESKAFAIVCLVILLILLAAVILDLCGVFDPPMWAPVAEYPFCNKHIVFTAAGRF